VGIYFLECAKLFDRVSELSVFTSRECIRSLALHCRMMLYAILSRLLVNFPLSQVEARVARPLSEVTKGGLRTGYEGIEIARVNQKATCAKRL